MAARWGAPLVRCEAAVGSTLDLVHALGAGGAPEGAVAVALEQTAGRGRDGRTWRSPTGGVWLAMLFRPAQAEIGAWAIRAGLIVADVIDELVGHAVAKVKWPNDVLLDDRKVAGVLCEARWQGGGEAPQWLGVGIGINVANAVPPELVTTAVALNERVPSVRRIDVLDRLVPRLRGLGAGAAALTEAERAAFAGRDWLRGRTLSRPIAGVGSGLREDGALLVMVAAEGSIAVREGHVEVVTDRPVSGNRDAPFPLEKHEQESRSASAQRSPRHPAR